MCLLSFFFNFQLLYRLISELRFLLMLSFFSITARFVKLKIVYNMYITLNLVLILKSYVVFNETFLCNYLLISKFIIYIFLFRKYNIMMNIIKNSNFTKLNIKDGNIHKLRNMDSTNRKCELYNRFSIVIRKKISILNSS